MDALKLFQEYMGTGLIVLWFLVSLLYLWLTEKRKYIRVMFLYVPLVLLLVFFNPLVAKIVSQMADGEIYYRILWLLPVTPVIAFGTVQKHTSQHPQNNLCFLRLCFPDCPQSTRLPEIPDRCRCQQHQDVAAISYGHHPHTAFQQDHRHTDHLKSRP
jgi:hypothetical protein